MKHSNNKFRLKNTALPVFLCLVLSITIGASLFHPSTASAGATASDAELTKQAKASPICVQAHSTGDKNGKTSSLDACAFYWVEGYKHPTGSALKFCNGKDAFCTNSYSAGRAARNADVSAGKANSSDAQLTKQALASPICVQELAKYGNKDNKIAENCVYVYSEGYKNPTGSAKKFCVVKNPECTAIYNAGAAARKGAAAAGQAKPVDGDKTGSDAKKLTCDDSSAGPFTWVICPLMDLMVKAIGVVDDAITNQLSIDTSFIFSNGRCDKKNNQACASRAYYKAWQSFRNIALGLMAIVGLMILIAQALGMEVLDAYAIRKALPRLLIAAIGITVSWPLMQFAVTLSNDLGFGIRQLIYAPFVDLKDSVSLSLTGGAATTILGFTGLVLLEGIGILSLGATALLAVFIAILVLILRQVLIIMLLILSPIAIVAYILPNTQRVFKLWWESFSKALLMFPLIAAFIATGRVFSAIALNNNSNDVVQQLAGFVAYFAPYFLIPATFKLAGGAMSALGNGVHGASRPLSGMVSNYRGGLAKKNWAKTRAGKRWDENFMKWGEKEHQGVGKLLNRAAVNVLNQDELIPHNLGKKRNSIAGISLGKHKNTRRAGEQRTLGGIPLGKYKEDKIAGDRRELNGMWGFKRPSRKFDSHFADRTMGESRKLFQHIQQEQGGMQNNGWRALGGAFEELTDETQGRLRTAGIKHAPSSQSEIETVAGILQQSSDGKEVTGGQDLLSHAGTIANFKGREGMEYADAQVAGIIGAASTGRIEGKHLPKVVKQVSDRLGEAKGQRAYATALQLASQKDRPDLRPGYGQIWNPNTGVYEDSYSPEHYRGSVAVSSVRSGSDSAWQGAKGEAVTAAAMTFAHVARGQRAEFYDKKGDLVDKRSPEQIKADQQSVKTTIIHGMTGYHNDPGNRQEWAKIAVASGEWNQDEVDRMVEEGHHRQVSGKEDDVRNKPQTPEPQEQQQDQT